MIEIYKALRDQDCGRFAAFKETVQMIRALRKGCIEGIHVTLDVWDDRCWHERINDKIERLENRRVWGNPDITWAPYRAYELDEVDFAPVTEVDDFEPYYNGEFMVVPDEVQGMDYHPWRS